MKTNHALRLRPFTPLKTTFTALSLSALLLAGLSLCAASAAVMIDYVPVGNAGNLNDSTGYGSVGYDYNIGKYEVTLTQYSAFLNAVAATDTNALYNGNMGTNLNIAGITRSGISGAYSYAVAGDGNRPVTYVSMLDAMRFANWVGNGQPTGAQGLGTTEDGAYTMSLGGLAPRNVGAAVFVSSENEWYKAAYYDPTPGAGGGDNYWLYATQSNAQPNSRNGSVTDPNSANYRYDDGIVNGYNGGYAVTNSLSVTGVNALTAVGAFTQADSYYGTFDQTGNVWEWNEAVIGSSRGLRGGSWFNDASVLQSSYRFDNVPSYESSTVGFRLASSALAPIPEPTGIVTGVLLIGIAALRRRRRSSL